MQHLPSHHDIRRQEVLQRAQAIFAVTAAAYGLEVRASRTASLPSPLVAGDGPPGNAHAPRTAQATHTPGVQVPALSGG